MELTRELVKEVYYKAFKAAMGYSEDIESFCMMTLEESVADDDDNITQLNIAKIIAAIIEEFKIREIKIKSNCFTVGFNDMVSGKKCRDFKSSDDLMVKCKWCSLEVIDLAINCQKLV